ncbi:Hybrid peroxiredoxin hyPrx5 [Budvicia aquatica]|uniref:Hybrid peroxiredoxin hyPrx5 n=1 Tax=Budvicia aquatica TaxID=82979 RepID=A0A484ZE16_9GAMM|nr:Hybrid peroxiredoxin hyPrx5 [Budvicia aquatica]
MDSVLCVSVNDTFVMNAWKSDQHAENIRFIPDGNGEFTKGMNMLVEKADLGFGPALMALFDVGSRWRN